MMPQTPLQILLLAAVVLVSWAIGYFASTYESGWQARFRDERRFYGDYRYKTDRLNIQKTRRIAALESQNAALEQELAAVKAANEPVTDAPVEWLVDAPEQPVRTPVHDAVPVHAAAEISAETKADSAPDHAAEHEKEPRDSALMAAPIVAAVALPIATTPASHPDILPHVETSESVMSAIPLSDLVPDLRTEDVRSSDLTRIRGIDAALATKLAGAGIDKVEDIERMSAEDEKAIEIQLELPAGYIAREQWRLQAALLGSGEDGSMESRFAMADPA